MGFSAEIIYAWVSEWTDTKEKGIWDFVANTDEMAAQPSELFRFDKVMTMMEGQ